MQDGSGGVWESGKSACDERENAPQETKELLTARGKERFGAEASECVAIPNPGCCAIEENNKCKEISELPPLRILPTSTSL